ncbi:hypothetical protein CEXT_141151 [Caerostris extrusa]|uniref:PDZ domain-containing protein n=1 Tax=Caerostris extrusa TaxID=172846 RepID=A0AAV4SAB0_CAEEX|nr:hypothetical protein CEXT_141151 [Caerostris extrusa]
MYNQPISKWCEVCEEFVLYLLSIVRQTIQCGKYGICSNVISCRKRQSLLKSSSGQSLLGNSSNGKCADSSNPSERIIKVVRQEVGGLGLSIKGGAENKLPILISRIFKDQAGEYNDQTFIYSFCNTFMVLKEE